MADTDVICSDPGHEVRQYVAIAGICTNSLGTPLVFFLMLKHYGCARLHQKEVAEKLGFLYNGYEDKFYWWECMLLLRKACFACVFFVSTVRYPSRNAQLGIKSTTMLVISISFVVLHTSCEPFDNRFYFLLDRIEMAMLSPITGMLIIQV